MSGPVRARVHVPPAFRMASSSVPGAEGRDRAAPWSDSRWRAQCRVRRAVAARLRRVRSGAGGRPRHRLAGGSATASDDLFLAIQRLAKAKPVVAAIRGVGASGSYLAALGARRIVANPTAVVGSITAISVSPHLPALLERIGVSVAETRAGRLKGMGSPWREDTDEERAKEQALVDGFYEAFVDRVAEGLAGRHASASSRWRPARCGSRSRRSSSGSSTRSAMSNGPSRSPPRWPACRHVGHPVRLRRPFFARLVDRFAMRLAASIADEVDLRTWNRYRF